LPLSPDKINLLN